MFPLSSSIADHAADPRGRGTMPAPSAVGRANLGGRPPEVTVYLKVVAGTVERAMFEAQGCGYTVACCSVLVELVEGKPLSFCRGLAPAEILNALDEVPAHRRFCATLAVEALQDAVARLEDKD